MKNKILIMPVLLLSAVCGFSTKTHAQADVAVLMQKMQELENKSREISREMERRMNEVIPVGTILPFGGGAVPIGFLPCDGSVRNEAEQGGLYKKLCQTLRDSFGKYCQLPDLRGRAPIGEGKGDATSVRILGKMHGEETHTLTIEEMPKHNHGIRLEYGAEAAYSGSTPKYPPGGLYSSVTSNLPYPLLGLGEPKFLSLEGGGTFHNIMQPSLVVKYMIKF